MMAKNSNMSAAGIFGPRRRSSNGSSSPRLIDAQELWDIDDVADDLGVTKQTIYSWRTTGYGPAGFRVGQVCSMVALNSAPSSTASAST